MTLLHTYFSDHPSEELLNQLECKCCDCGKSFDSADQLNTHLQLVHLREVSLGTIYILRKHFKLIIKFSFSEKATKI